jgi:hypothetical protein
MEPEIVVRDDHETGGEISGLRILNGQSRHKRLAAAIPATQKFDRPFTILGQVELTMDLVPLVLDPDGKGFDSPDGNQSLPQAFENVFDIAAG